MARLDGYQITFFDPTTKMSSCIRLIYSNSSAKQVRKKFELTIKDPDLLQTPNEAKNAFTYYFGKVKLNSLIRYKNEKRISVNFESSEIGLNNRDSKNFDIEKVQWGMQLFAVFFA